MPSQFFGLNIAASALNAFQASVNTAANNVSNVQTKGYSKQVTNKEAGEGMACQCKIRNHRNRSKCGFCHTTPGQLL